MLTLHPTYIPRPLISSKTPPYTPGRRQSCAYQHPGLMSAVHAAKSDVSYQGIRFEGDGLCVTKAVSSGQVLFKFASDLAISGMDAESDPNIAPLLEDKGDLIKLTLWFMNERTKGGASEWFSFVKALPEKTLSPILWTEEELTSLLFGSPVIQEAKNRQEMLRSEWSAIESMIAKLPTNFNASFFTDHAFSSAFSVILASAFYLPSAETFALLPPIHNIKRTGNEDGCSVDYDPESDAVILTANTDYNPGDEIKLYDGRPNGEMVLASGTVELTNPSDFLNMEFELVLADRLYTAKRQILENLGYKTRESFPIYKSRIPVQLLSFLRLSRVQDLDQLMQVSFTEDKEISQMNEYEILQLVLGEARVRLSKYQESWESDITALQNNQLTEKEQMSRNLLLSEKKILQSCVDIARHRLAPIRGIPSKSGKLEDPNKDINELFKAIEELPSVPQRALEGFMSWAKGDFDPDWKKNQKR